MKILLYRSKVPLSHVISNNYLVSRLRTAFILRHVSEHWCTQTGVNLHWMFLIMCLHKNTVQALFLFSLHVYPKFCTGKREKLHTYVNFTFCLRVCFILLRPRPLARSPVRKFLIHHLCTPSIEKNLGSPMSWKCFKCLILAVVPPWTLLGANSAPLEP